MILSNDAGCPGVFLPVRNTTAGICIGCARFGEPGQQIEPMAKHLSGGVLFCPNRITEIATEQTDKE